MSSPDQTTPDTASAAMHNANASASLHQTQAQEIDFWKYLVRIILLALFSGVVYLFIQYGGQRVELGVLKSQYSSVQEIHSKLATISAELATAQKDIIRVQEQATQIAAIRLELGEIRSQYEVFNVEFADQREEVTTLRNKVSTTEQTNAKYETAINTLLSDESRFRAELDKVDAHILDICGRLSKVEALSEREGDSKSEQ